MNSKAKTLGLALVAVFALSAVTAQGAWAAEEFHSSSANGKTIWTGSQHTATKDVFTFNGDPAECNEATFKGTLGTATSGSITVKPTYTECTFLGAAATVTVTDCAYILYTATIETPNTGFAHGKMEIECAAGNVITVSAVGCTISIGPQIPKDGVIYTNLQTGGVPAEVTLHATAKEIVYTTNNGFACKLAGIPAADTDGIYVGTELAKGYEDLDASPQATPTTPGTTTEGSQVHIWKE